VKIIEKDFDTIDAFISKELYAHRALIFPELKTSKRKLALELVVDGKVCGAVTGCP